jgi:hypothetical protein
MSMSKVSKLISREKSIKFLIKTRNSHLVGLFPLKQL